MFRKVYLHLAPNQKYITIVKNSNRASVFKIYSTVLSELSWITPKCKEICSVSLLINFVEFHVFEEHHRNAIEISIIGYLISVSLGQK